MEKVKKAFILQHNKPGEVINPTVVEYPKYMYPVIDFKTALLVDRTEKLLLCKSTSYYPIRSKEGILNFIRLELKSELPLSSNQNQENFIENHKKHFEDDVLKFIFFNNYHKMSNEDIERYNQMFYR